MYLHPHPQYYITSKFRHKKISWTEIEGTKATINLKIKLYSNLKCT